MEMRIFKRNAAIGVVAATFGFVAQAVAAQTVHIPDLAMLTTRVQQAHPEFVATRATLMAAIADYNVRARQLTSDCHGVDPDDQTRIENCQSRQAQLRVELRKPRGRRTDRTPRVGPYALENAPYRPSGNGMVGGTGWIVGYNVPKPTPELIAKSRARPFCLGIASAQNNTSDGGSMNNMNDTSSGSNVHYKPPFKFGLGGSPGK